MRAPRETTYAVDGNGCSHNNLLSFQEETNKVYYDYEENCRFAYPDKKLSNLCLKRVMGICLDLSFLIYIQPIHQVKSEVEVNVFRTRGGKQN